MLVLEASVSLMRMKSYYEFIRNTKILILDEATMGTHLYIHSEILLRKSSPFCSNFRQTLRFVPHKMRFYIVDASMKLNNLWGIFEIF